MYVYSIFIGSVFGLIPVLPTSAAFHFTLLKADKRTNIKTTSHHVIGTYLFSFVLLSILCATGISSARLDTLDVRMNLIPFDDITTNTIQYILNIFLFIPLGFLLPMLWKKFEMWKYTFTCGFLLSFSIEFLQLFNHRATDIDDLLMNTLGTMIGYFLFMRIKKAYPQINIFSIEGKHHWKWEPYCYFFLAYLVMFTIQPFIASWLLRLIF